MRFSEQFELPLAPDAAYELLLDLERVVPCVPGATLGADESDGGRALSMEVKLGPMRFTYDGSVRIAEQDAGARRAVLAGSAREVRGQGSAEGRVTMQVTGQNGRSMVTAELDATLAGRAAQMGQGVVQSVAKELVRQMSACIQASIDQPPAAPVGPGEPTPPEPPRQQLSVIALLVQTVRSWLRGLRGRRG
ncbi:MAG TPA: SRPBCC family protein [Thermoleophilaceae bacterium]|nr:SRPBCC family protein [Thermoleophilaceae bacterium]